MSKKLAILGMELDNYTVREAMLKVEVYLNSAVMNTVETVSMETLVAAQADEELKACLESLDLAVIQDTEILEAAGEGSPQRMRETAEREFQREFLKCASRNNRTVYLLGDTSDQVDALREFLGIGGARRSGSHLPAGRIKVAGSYALADCEGDYDKVSNEINSAGADIILSVVPSPVQERFLAENKEKLNAKIWYGMGDSYAVGADSLGLFGLARRLFQKIRMKSMMLRYEKTDERE